MFNMAGGPSSLFTVTISSTITVIGKILYFKIFHEYLKIINFIYTWYTGYCIKYFEGFICNI